MKHERFRAKLAALDGVQPESDPVGSFAVLRKALKDRSNYVVAKAATLLGDAYLTDLVPDALAAFHRLLADGDDDPGCEGKKALAKALKDLDYHDPDPFLLGLAHVQMEPVWGGRVDTAGPLRGTCAQALVACTIDATFLLSLLVDRFVDTDKWVRIDVARAIAQLDRPESALLIRLKALCGDADQEVIGQCFVSLIELATADSIAFVARFLENENDDVRFEAVGALAQARSLDAFEHVVRFWEAELSSDLRRGTIAALAGSPHPEAAEFLFEIVRSHGNELATAAIAALASSRFRNETRGRLYDHIEAKGSDIVRRAFDEHFSAR